MLALHISTPETEEILGSTNTSLLWGFLPKHSVTFRKQSMTALYTQHFCFHFHSASIELSPGWSMLDPQCSAVPQWSLLQDLQGSSSNWKKEKPLFLYCSSFHLWVPLTVAGYAGKQKPGCQNTVRKEMQFSQAEAWQPKHRLRWSRMDLWVSFYVCAIFKCAVNFPPADNPP